MNVDIGKMWSRIVSIIAFSAMINLADASSYTIGLSTWSDYPDSLKGFKEALAEAGFVEGKNIQYLERNAEANRQQQKQIAEEFTQKKVDLVYSLTTSGTTIIKEILPASTPIVFSIVTYPADAGLIESFDYSANNLVGTSNFVLLKHYVNLLKSLLPNAKAAAIFHRKGEPNSKIQAVGLTRLLKREGINVIDRTAENLEQLALVAHQVAPHVDVFITTTDTLLQGGGEKKLIAIAHQHRLPILSSNKSGILAGSTFGPVADFYQLGKMSGVMAVKILRKKATPSLLRSKLQDPPSVLINTQSAESLDLIIPSTLTDIIYVK